MQAEQATSHYNISELVKTGIIKSLLIEKQKPEFTKVLFGSTFSSVFLLFTSSTLPSVYPSGHQNLHQVWTSITGGS